MHATPHSNFLPRCIFLFLVLRDVSTLRIAIEHNLNHQCFLTGIVYGKDLLDLTEHQIEQTYKVNVLAHFWTLRQFLPSMMKQNHGHIVTTASTVGKDPANKHIAKFY